MREHFLPILTVLAIVLCIGILAYNYFAPRAVPYLENQIPGVTVRDVGIDAIIADTEEERVQGLSGFSGLGPREGLLMIFDRSDYHAIWMKDMNFPIDIIWIGEDLTIIDVTEGITPESYPAIFEPSTPARMALEVNARFVATHKLKIGDPVYLNEAYIPRDLKKNE
jgi:uncharacterized membrane protein (UPF0127 family)